MKKSWIWLSDETIFTYARPLATGLLTLVVLLLSRHILIRWLYKRAGDEESLSYIIPETVRVPSLLWCIAAAVKFGLDMSIIPAKYTGRASTAIEAFIIISITMVVASASVRALTTHGRRAGVALAFSGLTQTLIRVVVFTCGLVALLHLYNVNVTPLLTALGVGGLAVALALQDTLANFFAGIHILVEAPIALGNYIRLSTGEEGMVTDIGWRTTRVRNGNNNVVVIPNTKITSGILVNYNLPETRQTADVAVLVAYEADLDQVQRTAIEETRSAKGVLPTPEPSILFNPGLLTTHMQFTVTFTIADFAAKTNAQSEVRLRIYRRLKKDGIPLPHPQFEAKPPAAD
jgi:small-conductance mechanosensitive channel